MCNLSSCYQQFWWWVEFICNVWYLVDYKWTLGLKFLRILLHNVEQVLKYPKHEGTEVHVWPIWRLQNTTEYVSVILGPMGDLRLLGGSKHEGTEVHVWPIWRLQNTTEYVSVILGPMGDLRLLGGSKHEGTEVHRPYRKYQCTRADCWMRCIVGYIWIKFGYQQDHNAPNS